MGYLPISDMYQGYAAVSVRNALGIFPFIGPNSTCPLSFNDDIINTKNEAGIFSEKDFEKKENALFAGDAASAGKIKSGFLSYVWGKL